MSWGDRSHARGQSLGAAPRRFRQRAGLWAVAALTITFVAVGPTRTATALPRMSLTAGSPCATCHVSPQGGGARNDIGWGMALDTAIFTPAAFKKLETNGFLDGKVMLGLDSRLQMARLGRPSAAAKAEEGLFDGFTKAQKPDLVVIPMQMQPALTLQPVHWLALTGSYNFSTAWSIYPGQSPFDAQVILHGDPMLPTVRVGMIQPTIGIRHDDHTMLLRADALEPRRPLIPAGYAEWGGELEWQPVSWLRLDAGGFVNSNLRAASVARAADPVRASDDGLVWSARAMILPQWMSDGMDQSVNAWAGISALGSGKLLTAQVFAAVGRNEWGSLQIEASMGRGADGYETLALMALASYTYREWLVFEARAEQATASAEAGSGATREGLTRQFVLGAQIFPIPYIELRPEYRLIRARESLSGSSSEYILGQYTLQLHTYF